MRSFDATREFASNWEAGLVRIRLGVKESFIYFVFFLFYFVLPFFLSRCSLVPLVSLNLCCVVCRALDSSSPWSPVLALKYPLYQLAPVFANQLIALLNLHLGPTSVLSMWPHDLLVFTSVGKVTSTLVYVSRQSRLQRKAKQLNPTPVLE